MKNFLLLLIVILLGVIAWFLYEEHKKTPAEKAMDDVEKAIRGVGREIEGAAKEIEKAFEKKR